MASLSHNGNGRAVVLPSPRLRVLSGRGLSHRKSDKRWLAVQAANMLEGRVMVIPTVKQVAGLFHVCPAYVNLARELPLDQRDAILRGHDTTSFATLLNGNKAKVINPSITDDELVKLIRFIGINRVIDAAVAVEAAQ